MDREEVKKVCKQLREVKLRLGGKTYRGKLFPIQEGVNFLFLGTENGEVVGEHIVYKIRNRRDLAKLLSVAGEE